MNSTSPQVPLIAALPCRCQQPLRDQDTCALCGRLLPAARQPEPARVRVAPSNPWTRAGVVRALRAFAFFRGRAPARGDWNERMGKDWPPLSIVEQLFGSLPNAVFTAGLAPSRDQDVPSRAAVG